MKICLVRHGEPEFDRSVWIAKNGVTDALEQYAGSTVSTVPPQTIRDLLASDLVASRTIVVSSELSRARQSASLLGFEDVETSPLLNESLLPHPDSLPCRMPWGFVLALCRSAWLVGYRRNADGLRADIARADTAASWLANLASTHGEVIALGHGIMHRLIMRRLTTRGWNLQQASGHSYWCCMLMKKDN